MYSILALSWTLCAFVTLTSALNYTCCIPDQYDMGWRGTTGWSALPNTTGSSQEVGHLYYDFTNQKQATTVDTFNGTNKVSSFLDVNLYHTGKKYTVDLMKGTCKIIDLVDPFFRTCVPKDATSLGEFYIGLKPKAIKANAYSYVLNGVSVSSTVTYINKDECVPISNVITGETPTYSFMSVQSFINFELGLRNTTVFDIPVQCQ